MSCLDRVMGCVQGRPGCLDLGLSSQSLSHFMRATESPRRLGKQFLGPTPSFQSAKMAWVGAWDTFNKHYN